MICGQCESGSQRPAAIRVAGFHAWRKLGRFVKKGAKGIAIFAPCVFSKKAEPDNADSPNIKRVAGFTICYVFDQIDTDGDAIPTLTTCAAEGGEELLPQLELAASRLNVLLDYQEIREHGVEGFSTGGRIVIRTSLSTPGKCGVILHELCHEDLHSGVNRAEANTKTKAQRELEAEATAYVVMRHFGIQHVASQYLATYKVDGDQLRASLETISSAAKRLIAAIGTDNTGADANTAAATLEPEEELAPA